MGGVQDGQGENIKSENGEVVSGLEVLKARLKREWFGQVTLSTLSMGQSRSK